VGVADRARLLGDLLADLTAETAALDVAVADLEDLAWLPPTPAEGWTIAHQIAHLAWTDEQAHAAVTEPERFTARAAALGADPGEIVDAAASTGAAVDPGTLLGRWRASRRVLAEALTELPEGARIPWFGPPMSAASMATARLMETWAHGVDVTDALNLPPSVSPRLRAVAHLGVRTRDFAYAVRGLPVPAEPFRVELESPDGDTWTWGPVDAAQRITGPALDFCLRVTRRRHRADLALVAVGPDAGRWLDIAQAFAGPPGEDRLPAAAAEEDG
jgi:uncharacterized protein (TIGR03084 family)